jgi:hypothetical protein
MTDQEPNQRKDRRGIFRCCFWIVAYALLIPFIFIVYRQCTTWESGWHSRARNTLRSIGSAQLAYQAGTANKVYGSFQQLQDVGDIASGYRLGNMIEAYSMTWEVNNVSTVSTEEFPTGILSTFTIIAFPVDHGKYGLATFAITEDQVVRAYRRNRNIDLDNVHTWDPVL